MARRCPSTDRSGRHCGLSLLDGCLLRQSVVEYSNWKRTALNDPKWEGSFHFAFDDICVDEDRNFEHRNGWMDGEIRLGTQPLSLSGFLELWGYRKMLSKSWLTIELRTSGK